VCRLDQGDSERFHFKYCVELGLDLFFIFESDYAELRFRAVYTTSVM
jgi:hypothetical protein